MNTNSGDYFYDSADGLRLYCRIYPAQRAAGLPVLCLPGLTRNSRDFAALAAHLSSRREVLTADLRGRGRSAWDRIRLTINFRPTFRTCGRCWNRAP